MYNGRTKRTTCSTVPTSDTTATEYHALLNQLVKITGEQGNATCYRYNRRGRKVAEWGTAVQPAVFSYGDADRMASLTTFRASDGDITTDPPEHTDGDTTRRSYHDATGHETRKTYADGTHVDKTYDAYNHLGRLIQVVDDADTRTIACNRYSYSLGYVTIGQKSATQCGGFSRTIKWTLNLLPYNDCGIVAQIVQYSGSYYECGSSENKFDHF